MDLQPQSECLLAAASAPCADSLQPAFHGVSSLSVPLHPVFVAAIQLHVVSPSTVAAILSRVQCPKIPAFGFVADVLGRRRYSHRALRLGSTIPLAVTDRCSDLPRVRQVSGTIVWSPLVVDNY